MLVGLFAPTLLYRLRGCWGLLFEPGHTMPLSPSDLVYMAPLSQRPGPLPFSSRAPFQGCPADSVLLGLVGVFFQTQPKRLPSHW